MKSRTMELLGGFCLVGVTFSGLAQTPQTGSGAVETSTLEEIVVTAERRTSDVQSTAVSISVRSGTEMATQGRYSLADILRDVPGVVGGAAESTGAASGSDSPSSGITIRGIQSNVGAAGSTTSVAPSTAIYTDGVLQGIGGNYDLERVEVLRGPQGTLYGRSATAGVVAISTADPGLEKFGGNVALEAGNYDLQHYSAAVNVPIVNEVLGVRVAANRYEYDGYLGGTGSGGPYTGSDGRIKLLWKPNDDLSILFGAAHEKNTTDASPYTVYLTAPNTYDYRLPANTPIGTGENESQQYWAKVSWNMPFATLTYQPAYRSWKSTAVSYIRAAPIIVADQNIATPKDHFITHELHITSNPDSALVWQAGALYYKNSLANMNGVFLSPSGVVAFNSITRDKTTTELGVFAQATYPLSASWRITGGLRYDDTEVAVDQTYTSINPATGLATTLPLNGEAGIRRFNNVTYKARLEHDLTLENMVYASVSTGVSPGDITITSGAAGPIPLELDEETLTAYELGSKNRFLDNSLQLNGSIYYYDYTGYQTAGVDITGQRTFVTLASPAQSYGGELEIEYLATSRDRIGLNVNYTKADFVDKSKTQIQTGPGTYVTFGQFFAQDGIPGVIPFTASVSYAHTLPLPGNSTLTLRADVRRLASHDASNGQLTTAQVAAGQAPAYVRVDSQVIGDLSLNWLSSSGRYGVNGYVHNIDDSQYKTRVTASDSVTPAGAVVTTYTAQTYAPRTYGVIFNAQF